MSILFVHDILLIYVPFRGVQSAATSDLWGCAVCVLCSHTSLEGGCRASWHSPRSRGSQSTRQNGAGAGNHRPDDDTIH